MRSKTELIYEDIPDRMFIEARKKREIVRARLLTPDEKKRIARGSPDVLIQPLIGADYLISRNDIMSFFRYTGGSRVKTSGWESGKRYILYRDDDTTVMVMQVPKNHFVKINRSVANDRDRKSGDYIVCPINEDGSVDRSTASVVPSSIFRKMCYIPNSEVITRNRGSKNKFFDFFNIVTGGYKSEDAYARTVGINEVASGASTRQSKNPENGMKQSIVRPATSGNRERPLVDSRKTSIEGLYAGNQLPAKFRVVAQILDPYGKRVGFVVASQSGATKQATKDQVLKLAINHKIENVKAVKRGEGDYFIQGNGISIEDLPIRYLGG